MQHLTRHAKLIVTTALVLLASMTALAGEIVGSDAYSTAIGTIDRDDATWNTIGPAGIPITGMTYDSSRNVLWGISPTTDCLYSIDQTTGAAEPIGMPGDLGYDNANGLAYDPINDLIYATDNNTNHLFTINPQTGVGTMVAEINGGFTEIEGLGFDPVNGILYGLTQLQGRIVSIDPANGLARSVSDQLPDEVWRGLEWDPQYGVLYASAVNIFEDASIYNFNPENGRLDFRGHTIGVEAVQGLAVIPEPSAILLCLFAVSMIARRRA